MQSNDNGKSTARKLVIFRVIIRFLYNDFPVESLCHCFAIKEAAKVE